MNETRANWLYLARLAEQNERFDDMAEFMGKVAKEEPNELSIDERNLFSIAFKNVVGSRRIVWRQVNSTEQREEARGNVVNAGVCREYRQKIEGELSSFCKQILEILESHLIRHVEAEYGKRKVGGDISATNSGVSKEGNTLAGNEIMNDPLDEARVYYYKMAGDYNRYMAEYTQGQEKDHVAGASLTAYQRATEIAEQSLDPTNPIRLGLALNFSVFYFEIQGDPEGACNLAQGAFDLAMSRIDGVSEESYKESTMIMHLLRDNLTLWKSDMAEKSGNNTRTGAPTAMIPENQQQEPMKA